MTTSFVNWNKTNTCFRQDNTTLHQTSPQQCNTLHLITNPCMHCPGLSKSCSSCPVGKHKCNISGRHSVMYLSTFSFPFQIGIVNSGDERVSGWEKSPSCTRELTCQCPLLTRTSLACCYESTDISTFTLTQICYKRHPRALFHLPCVTVFICCHWDREQM